MLTLLWIIASVLVALLFFIIFPSIRHIGPTEIGLPIKRFSIKKLTEDNPIAFKGEPGYQATLLMPGLRFKLNILYKVKTYPWVQVPAGEIGVVIAQVGSPLPIGAKSAVYKKEFGIFTDLEGFIKNGGQKGVQRPVLSPGTLAPIHPVAFLVITKRQVYGIPVDPEIRQKMTHEGVLRPESFGLTPQQLELVRIGPEQVEGGNVVDKVGIVTTFEGEPLQSGHFASRIGSFDDIAAIESKGEIKDTEIIEALLGSKNSVHNNYQDYQAFLDYGGKIGMQHDPLLYGAYTLNPFLVRVEMVPMLVVQQGEVAVIKSYVGLATQDMSGDEFKFGSLVRPGHRGIWEEPLRTGKYPINPRCYEAEIVPTAILTLNWAEAVSAAHNLDRNLQQIVAKSREGFVFKIDLQVQIHVPDKKAPRVISMVGTMFNLVNEVLQAAVGNHFRDKLQSMKAVQFIEERQRVQKEAFDHIEAELRQYEVETRGAYIQDVILPQDIVTVLTQREIAAQQIETFQKQKSAQDQRIEMEKSKGVADKQSDLASSEVNVKIQENKTSARKIEADGEATFTQMTGQAKGAEVRAVGMAKAEAYERQVAALGKDATAFVDAITALADKGIKIVPDILVGGGGQQSSLVDGLLAMVMRGGVKGLTSGDSKP
jgi:hypothetical protein